jgi:hypothetical protein
LGSSCDLGSLDGDPPGLATEVPIIGPPDIGAVLLEKMPLIADHRIEPFDVLGKLGHDAHEIPDGLEAIACGRIWAAVADAAHSVNAVLNAKNAGTLKFRFTSL